MFDPFEVSGSSSQRRLQFDSLRGSHPQLPRAVLSPVVEVRGLVLLGAAPVTLPKRSRVLRGLESRCKSTRLRLSQVLGLGHTLGLGWVLGLGHVLGFLLCCCQRAAFLHPAPRCSESPPADAKQKGFSGHPSLLSWSFSTCPVLPRRAGSDGRALAPRGSGCARLHKCAFSHQAGARACFYLEISRCAELPSEESARGSSIPRINALGRER